MRCSTPPTPSAAGCSTPLRALHPQSYRRCRVGGTCFAKARYIIFITGQQCGPLAHAYVQHLGVAIDTLLAQPAESARHLQVCRFWIQGTLGLGHHFPLQTLCALDATLSCWARVHEALGQSSWDEATRAQVHTHALLNLTRTLCNWLSAMHRRGDAQVRQVCCWCRLHITHTQDRLQRLAREHPALIAALLTTAAAQQHPSHASLLPPLLSVCLPVALDALDAAPCATTLRALAGATAAAVVVAVRGGDAHVAHAVVVQQAVMPSPQRCIVLATTIAALARYDVCDFNSLVPQEYNNNLSGWRAWTT